ncbi:RnfH family protein [Paludibacterium paludis]|nr:RnfH family protein [Paludibacterium paludis]
MTETVRVEVALATPERQALIALEVPAGTTAAEAVALSGIAARFPSLDVAAMPLGIFGKTVPGSRVLIERDRVELYRPLIADPKTVRRDRVEAERAAKRKKTA